MPLTAIQVQEYLQEIGSEMFPDYACYAELPIFPTVDSTHPVAAARCSFKIGTNEMFYHIFLIWEQSDRSVAHQLVSDKETRSHIYLYAIKFTQDNEVVVHTGNGAYYFRPWDSPETG